MLDQAPLRHRNNSRWVSDPESTTETGQIAYLWPTPRWTARSQARGGPLPCLDPDQRDAQRTIPGAYRLTFTITETEGNKQVNSQHYVVAGDPDAPPTELRMGTEIPIKTGATGPNALRSQTEISYIDIGLEHFHSCCRERFSSSHPSRKGRG